MAEILSFLSYEECLALVDMQSLLVHVVDITQLLAPKGWSKFTYYLGRAQDECCRTTPNHHHHHHHHRHQHPPPSSSSSLPLAVVGVQVEPSTSCSDSCNRPQDGLLCQGKKLLHVNTTKCLNRLSGTISEFAAKLQNVPRILVDKDSTVTAEDWLHARVVVGIMPGGGYRITVQRRVPETCEWKDLFSLGVSADPLHMTTSFLEEVPSVCGFNQAMNEQLAKRVGGYRSVSFDFKEGQAIFSCPRDRLAFPAEKHIAFQVAGVYDPSLGVFAWGWAVEHIPKVLTEAVSLLANAEGTTPVPGIHHHIFEEASIRCDDRLAMVLAGFVTHRLRSKYSMVYRHHDPDLAKVFFLALDNQDIHRDRSTHPVLLPE